MSAAAARAEAPEIALLRWVYHTSVVAFGQRVDEVDPLPEAAARVVDGPNGALFLPWLCGLNGRFPDAVPAHLVRKCLREGLRVGGRNVRILEELRAISDALESERISWAALKGLDALVRFYPGLEWRMMADVDLLVAPRDLARAIAVLSHLGFGHADASAPGRHAAHAVSMTNGVLHVDLHRGLLHAGADAVRVEALLERTSLGEAGGVPVRTLSPGAAFATSALLLAKDLFLPATTSPCRVVELALLHEMAGEDAVDAAHAAMRRWRVRRHFERAVSVARWIARDEPRPEWLDARFGDPVAFAGPTIGRTRFMLATAAMQDDLYRAGRFLAVNFADHLRRRVSA